MEKSKNFFSEIKRRITLQFKPFNHLYFLVLFFFITAIGGFGIWYTLFDTSKDDYHAVLSFSIFQFCSAIITTSLIDIYTNDKIIYKKSFNIYSLAGIIILSGFFYFACTNNNIYFTIGSFLCLIFTLTIWHLANCDNEKFSEESYNAEIKAEAHNKHGNDW